jgi:outer membrane protein assembly factor BamA
MGSIILSIGRDNSKREDYTFKGGSDDFEISFNDSLSGEDFQYWRYRLYSQRFFPVSNDGRKVIAVRALVETNRPTGGNAVPFFDMPVLGTNQTLRGFKTFRFRDQTALAASLEYRYRIWPQFDMGLFVDEGQVAPQLGDLGLNRFHTGYGARLFIWPKPNFPISIDYGRSSETWRIYVNFRPRF